MTCILARRISNPDEGIFCFRLGQPFIFLVNLFALFNLYFEVLSTSGGDHIKSLQIQERILTSDIQKCSNSYTVQEGGFKIFCHQIYQATNTSIEQIRLLNLNIDCSVPLKVGITICTNPNSELLTEPTKSNLGENPFPILPETLWFISIEILLFVCAGFLFTWTVVYIIVQCMRLVRRGTGTSIIIRREYPTMTGVREKQIKQMSPYKYFTRHESIGVLMDPIIDEEDEK